jgi:hypothetical protein
VGIAGQVNGPRADPVYDHGPTSDRLCHDAKPTSVRIRQANLDGVGMICFGQGRGHKRDTYAVFSGQIERFDESLIRHREAEKSSGESKIAALLPVDLG